MSLERTQQSRRLGCSALASVLVTMALAAPVAADFPEVINSQPPGEAPPTAPQAADSFTVPAGFQVTLFAGDPDVRQPIAMTMDDRGRLWIAECYTFEGHHFDGQFKDRIIILADTDQDGRFDERKVFWDQGYQLAGIEWGFGGLWILQEGQLQVLADADGDDLPDRPPETLLDGFTLEAEHNVVNGLLWGPDGWLYGRHGILASSLVGKPGTPDPQRVPLNCAIWRYHPTRKVFEVVTHGTTNPWGMDYDDHGEMFFTNNVTGHLWHVVPGAHFERMYGEDFNPHLYQLMGQCADHYHWDAGQDWTKSRDAVGKHRELGGGHSHCGGMIYLGDNWPAEYRNSILMCNTHGRRINRDLLVRRGSGYVGQHAADMLFANNPWFRGVSLLYGPDGAVYLSDWTDLGECHDHDGVHRTSGRIYKITYQAEQRTTKHAAADVSKLDQLQLVELQLHSNDWWVRHARRVLQERAAAGTDLTQARRALLEIYDSQAAVTRRLRAMWALSAIDAVDHQWLLAQCSDPNEHIRVWAIRLLVDRSSPDANVVDRFAAMARDDRSGLVRLYLASALQRLPLPARWSIAGGLASHAGDAEDAQLPLMIWYGIEPAVTSQPKQAIRLAARTQIPQLRHFIARRITSELQDRPEAVAQLVELVQQASPTAQLDLLSGMAAALHGWRKADPPAVWWKVQPQLLESGSQEVRSLARELAVVFGDGRALEDLVQIAADVEAHPAQRRQALQVLTEAKPAGLESLLQQLVTDRATAQLAVRALAEYQDPRTAQLLVERYGQLKGAARQEAINTLVARVEYAHDLLEAVAAGSIPAEDIAAYHARQIMGFGDPRLEALLDEHWGTIRQTPQEKRTLIDSWKSQLTAATDEADLAQGRVVYQKTCAACHKLYGEGGQIGPAITGSNRDNLDYLLENIIDPSAVVAQGFTVSTIVLNNGRLITGTIVQTTQQTIAVQTAEERMVIDRSEVDEIAPSELSLMPDGLLQTLDHQQIINLIAYLRSREQVPLPE